MEKKSKFTVFDVIVIILIVAIIGGGAYYFLRNKASKGNEEKNIYFTVEVSAKDEAYAKLLSEGKTVTVSGGGTAKIVSVEAKDAVGFSKDTVSGKFIEAPIPGKYDVYVTVYGAATENEKDISIGNAQVKVGAKLSLEGSGFTVNGPVVEMHYESEGK